MAATLSAQSALPNQPTLMSRQTSSPLPDLASLPTDFLDHLLLVTQTLVNSKPPPAVLRAMSRDPTRKEQSSSSAYLGTP